jgi:tRNA(Ile)-lysidine synthase
MLSIWREEVLAYLEALAQPFRFDCSNSSNRYTRNRIRNEILPELEKSIHPNAKRNMVEASKNFSELYSLVDTQACDFRDRWVARIGYETIIPTIPLAELHSALRKEVLRQIWFVESWPIADMSHQHWTLLSEMVVGQASLSGDKPFVQSFPGDVMVRIDAERVSLKRKGDSNA